MKKIVLLIISSIFLLLSICIVIGRVVKPIIENKKVEKEIAVLNENISQYNNDNNNQASTQEEESETVQLEATDSNLVKIYVGKYINYINKENFTESYNMLASNFKSINFDTQDKYEDYWKQNFPSFCVIKYISIKREGNVITARVQINDISHTIETISQVFTIIKENNQYKISFGVVKE